MVEIWDTSYGMFNLEEKAEFLLSIYYVPGTVLGIFVCYRVYSSQITL